MKKVISYFLLFCAFVTARGQNDSTSFLKSLQFNGVTGIKVFNPYASYQPITKGALYFPLNLGIEMYSPQLGLSVDARQSYFNSLSGRDSSADILYSRKHTSIGVTYHFKRKTPDKQPIRLGVGYISITTKNIFTSYYGVPYKMKGGYIFFGIPLSWLDVELRAEPDQEEILEWDKVSVNVVYRFGARRRMTQRNHSNALNLLIGSHLALNRNYYNPNKGTDIFSPVMAMPEIGLQYTFLKYNLSLEARRNMWLSFTAGDPRYDINGNMEHLFVGLSRQRTFGNNSFTYGLSHVWIRDISNPVKIPSTSPNSLEYYTEKGIALTLSYPIRKINIETRGIYAYHINEFINSPVINKFDKYRISVGAIYKINPFK